MTLAGSEGETDAVGVCDVDTLAELDGDAVSLAVFDGEEVSLAVSDGEADCDRLCELDDVVETDAERLAD